MIVGLWCIGIKAPEGWWVTFWCFSSFKGLYRNWEVEMSRREIAVIILVMLAIFLMGFVFGRVILPRIIMWNIGTKINTPEAGISLRFFMGQKEAVSISEVAGFPVRNEEQEEPGEDTAEGADLLFATAESSHGDSWERGPEYIAEPEHLSIDVDVSMQTVKVYQDGEVIREMIASTGVEGHETPLGTFEVQNRGLWFFNAKYGQGAKYWVSFKDWGIYLFHSLAMDENGEIIEEEAEKLGQPASHGCIRLQVEDAKWIYDNIPEGTTVSIHD